MKNNSSGLNVYGILALIGFIALLVVAVSDTNKPKCKEPGCDYERAKGSSYCYIHKPNVSNKSSYKISSYSSKSTSSYTKTYSKPTYNSYNSKSNTSSNYYYFNSSKSTYDAYDDGYDDIYMDEDYDYERYDRDSEYAAGVDDAMDDVMDEFGEDW